MSDLLWRGVVDYFEINIVMVPELHCEAADKVAWEYPGSAVSACFSGCHEFESHRPLDGGCSSAERALGRST